MKVPELPSDEPERLASLRSLEVLDTPAEERFDRITRLAKGLFGAPIALVSLVDEKRQWFKSRQGLLACETARDISFCGHAILGEDVFWVEDALEDPMFCDNPLVQGPPHIRFYAGHPLQDKAGRRLGTLCVIDSKPHAYSAEKATFLADLGHVAESELAALQLGSTLLQFASPDRDERKDRIDPVTGVWNRKGMLEILQAASEHCAERGLPATLIVGGIQEQLADTWTADGGDIITAEVAQALRGCIRNYDALGRIADDQFLLFLVGCGGANAPARVAALQRRIDESTVLQSIDVRLDFGFVVIDPAPEAANVDEILSSVSAALERARCERVVPGAV